MSDLSVTGRQYLEEIFEMKTGYVLDYSDSTFYDLFSALNIVLNWDEYEGLSKANKLRKFWSTGTNLDVKKVTETILEKWRAKRLVDGDDSCEELYNRCYKELNTLNIEQIELCPSYLQSPIAIESYKKIQRAFKAEEFEIVLSQSRTLLEETLKHFYIQLTQESFSTTDTISSKMKKVAKLIFKSNEGNWQKIINSLTNAIEAFGTISNEQSDRHPRIEHPSLHQAEFIYSTTVNIVKLLNDRIKFLDEQRDLVLESYKKLPHVRYSTKNKYSKWGNLMELNDLESYDYKIFKVDLTKSQKIMLIDHYIDGIFADDFSASDRLLSCLTLFIDELKIVDIEKLYEKYKGSRQVCLQYFLSQLYTLKPELINDEVAQYLLEDNI